MKLGLGKTLTLAISVAVGVARAGCPDYTTYAQSPHGKPSSGPLALPYMRPDPACRTFNSTSVEKVISDVKTRLKDPDVARLFENTFPNTLDTTVRYYTKAGLILKDSDVIANSLMSRTITWPLSSLGISRLLKHPSQFLILMSTFCSAQWLRDTGNQFSQYHALLSMDPELATLVKAVINNEARYITQYPYCGAFQPPPESGLAPSHNDWADNVVVNPPVDNQTVFECKYELDSLCSFVKLSYSYYEATKDKSVMNDNWLSAVNQIFRVINEQSQPTFDLDFNFISYYNWTGLPGSLAGAIDNGGNGEPKGYTGMVGTHHRPSDDLSVFAFLTPANAMLSVQLGNLANMLDDGELLLNLSSQAKQWSKVIEEAVWKYAVEDDVFAYETNGLGSRYVMDDANVPSLLALPYLGFLDRNHPAYVKTKKILMSRQNPYFVKGQNFSGIGGPHVDVWNPWPMSQISNIFGMDDDAEILESLYTIVNNTSGLGLIHESINIYNGSDYTRPWFAWANSYFGEMILDLAQRKPYLIFIDDQPYFPGL